MWWPMMFRALVCTTVLMVTGVLANDPIANCRPTGAETSLCVDKQDFCTGIDLDFIFDPDNYCKKGERPYINPAYPCSCDILCVQSLEDGEGCSAAFTSSYPTTLCATGLDCLQNVGNVGHTCQRNPDKLCVNLMIAYEAAAEAGSLGPGVMLPNCDDVGQFASKQCSSTSTCYCTDAAGQRLFGEAVVTEREEMDCECSLHWERNKELGVTVGLQCIANGNLDPLQCADDFCYCYNSTRRAVTQGPYHISQMQLLNCYKPNYHGENSTNPCTVAERLYLLENPEDPDNIVLDTSNKPNCGLDGYYATIQPRGTGFFCSDLHGEQIDDYGFAAAAKSDSTCHCATRRNLMTLAGLTTNLPYCCPNGNFMAYQTRGLFAYCVDVNGNQIGDAVAITDSESLPCAGSIC